MIIAVRYFKSTVLYAAVVSYIETVAMVLSFLLFLILYRCKTPTEAGTMKSGVLGDTFNTTAIWKRPCWVWSPSVESCYPSSRSSMSPSRTRCHPCQTETQKERFLWNENAILLNPSWESDQKAVARRNRVFFAVKSDQKNLNVLDRTVSHKKKQSTTKA